MSFDTRLSHIFDNAIQPAIIEAGYRAHRVDQVEHSDRIDDRILFEIKRSRFVVADFTYQRQGVYFEAGYALGLSIPVIWTCRRDEMKKLHFDTRQYNHIDWKSAEELKERLYLRISVLIG